MNLKNNVITDKKKIFFLALSLFLCSLTCVLLLIFRISITGSYRYKFFVWNLFLAWIPFFISLLLLFYFNKFKNWKKYAVFFITALFWLIFYPNSSYIISDFIYLAKYPIKIFNNNFLSKPSNIMWFDILLVFSFAFLGHFIGLISLFVFHKIFKVLFSNFQSWLFVFIAVILSGFGIYLGRFNRLNSWDLVTMPYETTLEITNSIFSVRALLFSIGFSLFTFVTYIVLYNFYNIGIKNDSSNENASPE
jgi:uncharacterized membrane protein